MKSIDLGQKSENSEAIAMTPAPKDPGVYYPTVYISDRKGVSGLKVGDEVIIKGRVKQVSERKDDDGEKYSCDIECESMDIPGGKTESMSKKSRKDEEEIDKGLDEEYKKEKT